MIKNNNSKDLISKILKFTRKIFKSQCSKIIILLDKLKIITLNLSKIYNLKFGLRVVKCKNLLITGNNLRLKVIN